MTRDDMTTTATTAATADDEAARSAARRATLTPAQRRAIARAKAARREPTLLLAALDASERDAAEAPLTLAGTRLVVTRLPGGAGYLLQTMNGLRRMHASVYPDLVTLRMRCPWPEHIGEAIWRPVTSGRI